MDPPNVDRSDPPPCSVEAITDYTESVIDYLDDYFGKGFAQEHDQLVAHLVVAIAIHAGALLTAQQTRAGFEGLAKAVRTQSLCKPA